LLFQPHYCLSDLSPNYIDLYDDGRKIPELCFSEDAIREYWDKKFPHLYSHVHSFIARDKEFYIHPRDRWVKRQVHYMKKYKLNFQQGFDYMERLHQRDLYVSKLERQHQLQQLQVRKKKSKNPTKFSYRFFSVYLNCFS
jgi:hypothetical protein